LESFSIYDKLYKTSLHTIVICDYTIFMSEIVVVQGYAGSGKSTHCERLSQDHLYNGESIAHVSAGTRLRAIRTGLDTSDYADLINDPHAPSPLSDEVVNGAMFERASPSEHGLTLIDGYPRHESGVEVFAHALRQGRHRLLGCVSLEVTQETSVARILSRGERRGELVKANTLAEFAVQRYQGDSTQTQAAIARLSRLAPIERVDANGDVNEVWQGFGVALGRLGFALDHFAPKES
jgi:adenylate kinase family enzyme